MGGRQGAGEERRLRFFLRLRPGISGIYDMPPNRSIGSIFPSFRNLANVRLRSLLLPFVFPFHHQQVDICSTSNINNHAFDKKPHVKGENPNVNPISHADISSVLEKIVSTASGKGPPFSVYSANADANESRVWKALLDKQQSFELRSNASLSSWMTYVELVAPSNGTKVSKLAIRILQTLNTKPNAQFDDFELKLTVPDAVYVVKNLKLPLSAYYFYVWLRKQSYYIPHKSLYGALIDRLSCMGPSPDIWEKLDHVMEDMLWKRVAVDSDHFEALLVMGCESGSKEVKIARMEWHLGWLNKMKKIGFLPSSTIYERLMTMCNELQMFELTFSIFNEIPQNMHLWSFKNALFACKETKNLETAEKLFNEMMYLNIKPDLTCFILVLDLYAHYGHADKVHNLFNEMMQIEMNIDIPVYTSIIYAYAKVGMIEEAHRIFKSIRLKLDSSIFQAMATSFKDAGCLNELLDLVEESKMHNIRLNSDCYEAAFQACIEGGQWKSSIGIIEEMWARSMLPSAKYFCTILHACRMVNDYSSCAKFSFESIKMELGSIEQFEETVAMYAFSNQVPYAIDAFKLMKDHGFLASDPEFYEQIVPLILRKSLSDAMVLFHDMRFSSHKPSLNMYVTLIREHVKAGDLIQSKRLFDDMLAAGVLLRINERAFSCFDEFIIEFEKDPVLS